MRLRTCRLGTRSSRCVAGLGRALDGTVAKQAHPLCRFAPEARGAAFQLEGVPGERSKALSIRLNRKPLFSWPAIIPSWAGVSEPSEIAHPTS